jgi:hypothetical protein
MDGVLMFFFGRWVASALTSVCGDRVDCGLAIFFGDGIAGGIEILSGE